MDFLLIVPVLLFSIVVHEVAHAWVAHRVGDDTAYMLGRITLNPLPHLDPMGSILVPLALHFMNAGFIFGWAKPVPINPRKFRNYKWGDIRVSMAGIVSNLILAVGFTLLTAVVLKVGPILGDGAAGGVGVVVRMGEFGILINLILAVFNLIPIPPLDGSHVFYHLLPPRLGARYRELGRYGMPLLMLLFVFLPGPFFAIVFWPVAILRDAAFGFIGLWL